MLSLLFAICMIWFVGKFFIFGLKASWGIMKLLCAVIDYWWHYSIGDVTFIIDQEEKTNGI